MEEKYELTQSVDTDKRTKNKKGSVEQKILKFAFLTEGDEVEIELVVKGPKDAVAARFGAWQFGLKPDPAKIGVVITPFGLPNAPAPVPVPAPQTPAPVAPSPGTAPKTPSMGAALDALDKLA